MFNSKHYVPILKWKRAEQGALKELKEKDKKYITPLIQLVMLKNKPEEKLEDIVLRFKEHVSAIPRKIVEVWGNSPIFFDVSLLFTTLLKTESLNVFMQEGIKLGAPFIPVLHLSDENEIKQTVSNFAKKNQSGACLRLVCSDFSDLTKLNKNIATFLSFAKLEEKDIDLLVDIKEIDENDDKYIKYMDLSQKIFNLKKWRTFIFACGGFPENLSKCKIDEENLISRVDWKYWINHARNKRLQRKPTFADYTIQHPIYKEATQFFPPTTSIKYTLEDEWLIMKGKKKKFELYLANAKLLVDDKRFYKKDFSSGDQYIAEKAKHYPAYLNDRGIKGTGSTETWLRAGLNHHLVLVARQIANLP